MFDERIFITGGAGFLGTALVKEYYGTNRITVYSRDEAKHYYLKKQFPNIKCVIGDVNDKERLIEASMGHSKAIFAASMKQIEAVDQNPSEAVKTIINGALNSRAAAETNHIDSCFISTDKSRAATTLYGSMKFVAGELFIVNSENSLGDCVLNTAIYGNVLGSTGSLIPLIKNAISNEYTLTLYSADMTRFMISVAEAVNLIDYALSRPIGFSLTGFNIIPKLKSFLVKDMFDYFKENFGLKYKIGKPRISEKIHEVMIAKEELGRVADPGKYYLMHYKNTYNDEVLLKNNEYNSKDFAVSKKDLETILKETI
jgi:UDP-N-acetylglucosamine 4,6-dehydratase/5-epimerase